MILTAKTNNQPKLLDDQSRKTVNFLSIASGKATPKKIKIKIKTMEIKNTALLATKYLLLITLDMYCVLSDKSMIKIKLIVF